MNNSILPLTIRSTVVSKMPILAKEWAWDFIKQDFALKDGRMYFVFKDEAIRLWIWKLFNTNRFEEVIYSWEYGNELLSLIGQGYSQGYIEAETERFIKEAIENNLYLYVLQILNLEISFKGTKLNINITLKTIYSEEVAFSYEI